MPSTYEPDPPLRRGIACWGAEYEGRWDDTLGSARALISLVGDSMPAVDYSTEAYADGLRVLVAGSAGRHAVSRRELRSAAGALCKFFRNFWNARAQVQGLSRQLLRRRIG